MPVKESVSKRVKKKKLPKSASPQIKLWQLYVVVGILFSGVLMAASMNFYLQDETDKKFKNLVEHVSKRAGPPVSEAEASAVSQEVLGAVVLDSKVATFSARAVLLGDLNSGKSFASKEARAIFPIASITKVMTALVARENLSLSDRVTVPPECTQLPKTQQQLGLQAGRAYLVEDLLYGLLVRSGADCACALASAFGGEAVLVESMNQKAARLGLEATHFQNTAGNDAVDNFSSAHDLFLLVREFMKDPVLRKIVGTTYFWGAQNTNRLLFDVEGVTGVKTGFTPGAGECLIATWVRRGKEYLGIVLGSKDRFKEMKELVRLTGSIL